MKTSSRRRFLVFVVACAAAVGSATRYGVAATAQDAAKSRPNIVMILADDMGYSDLGCYGGEIATPNLDRLAARGVRLTDFHNQARCCPSRATLMTGQYPHQVGIGTMIDGYAKWERDAANSPHYQDHLSKDAPTMAELLRAAGYRTIMCGKWHLGDRPEEWPAARGFDRSFVLIPGAMNYYGGNSKGPRAPMALDDKKFVPPHDGFFSTDAFADHAIEFVNEAAAANKPFFLYLAFNAPHWPLQAPPEDIAKYAHRYDAGWQPIRDERFKKQKELGIVPQDATMSPMDRGDKVKPWDELTAERRENWSTRMAIYAAQVTRLDANVGRLLADLDARGLTDNTLIVFCSDNGGAAEDPSRTPAGVALGTRDSFSGYARPWATVSNTPWRYHKCSAYEGGTSSPLIAVMPESLPHDKQGAIVREPAHLVDLLPTFLQAAGVKDAPKALEGRSILPMLQGEHGDPDRTYFWEHEGNRAVRKGHYKLVSLPEKPWELYDLSTDRIESHDIAADHPDLVKELSAEYDAWATRSGVVPWTTLIANRPNNAGGH